MRFPFDYALYRGEDDEEFDLRVIYEGRPGSPATYWQPADPDEVEIISVTCGGKPFALTEAEDREIEEACYQRLASDFYEEACEAAEWKAQCRRDDLLMRQWEASR